jgi:prepilin-type N-terminal cleavage/methylation domain-containing protein
MKRNIKGFTLIELLIVVVIIGILAAIAIPKFASTKEKAYLTDMKTDLRNLTTAEEGYASGNNGTYLTTGTAVGPDSIAALHYSPTAGVTVTVAASGTGGYTAQASMSGKTAKTCDVFVGNGATKVSGGYAVSEGAPACAP